VERGIKPTVKEGTVQAIADLMSFSGQLYVRFMIAYFVRSHHQTYLEVSHANTLVTRGPAYEPGEIQRQYRICIPTELQNSPEWVMS